MRELLIGVSTREGYVLGDVFALDAFPTRSAQELSRIFEGTARWEKGTLVITVAGQTAARLVPGEYGWFLEPEPDFRQAWNLDEYVYTAEYVSVQ